MAKRLSDMEENSGQDDTRKEAAIVPSSRYNLRLKEVSAGGAVQELVIPLDDVKSWDDFSLITRAVILKKTTWSQSSLPEILHVMAYAESLGLDILRGDVYQVKGRLATTNDAKIKHAMASGRIVGYEYTVEQGEPIEIEYESKGKECTWKGTNLKSTAIIHVKDWQKPVQYQATLKEWFMGSNDNWRSRTDFMMRKSTLAHALAEIVPLGTGPEEAPPVQTVELENLLKKSIEQQATQPKKESK